jgi:DNA (cytosine-5)-methyltransferase 1
MSVYYNDSDPFVCAWLRNLIAAGLIPAGEVDERPIQEVQPDALRGYSQCHFFAGIGGWAYALQLAGWDGPVWTGSCPCQPLSGAGQRKGHADQRHLWPAFYRLITECQPPVVFGEQVASKDGREWLAGVRADLEAVGYACGASDLCAAGAGAPHPRQRLYWVADADSHKREGKRLSVRGWRPREAHPDAGGTAQALRLPDAARQRSGATQSGNGTKETAYRWPHEAPPNRGFADGFGNVYRVPEPQIPFLDDGFPGIVDQIRAAGNAIVPQVAAAFVSAYMDVRGIEAVV